jgi:hypothetical protein
MPASSSSISTPQLTTDELLAGGPISLSDFEDWVYVALLTVGTTPPLFRAATANTLSANAGTAVPRLRYGLDAATGLTAMPAQLTPATMTAREAIWVALS